MCVDHHAQTIAFLTHAECHRLLSAHIDSAVLQFVLIVNSYQFHSRLLTVQQSSDELYALDDAGYSSAAPAESADDSRSVP